MRIFYILSYETLGRKEQSKWKTEDIQYYWIEIILKEWTSKEYFLEELKQSQTKHLCYKVEGYTVKLVKLTGRVETWSVWNHKLYNKNLCD